MAILPLYGKSIEYDATKEYGMYDGSPFDHKSNYCVTDPCQWAITALREGDKGTFTEKLKQLHDLAAQQLGMLTAGAPILIIRGYDQQKEGLRNTTTLLAEVLKALKGG